MGHSVNEGGAGKPVNALFVCFGGLSNTGYITALAATEAVRRQGLGKAAIMCLAGLPAGVKSVAGRAARAKRIITVDGCANRCARKVVEAAGLAVNKGIVLSPDLGIVKVPFFREDGAVCHDPMNHVADADVAKAVEAILKACEED
ncbi:MAG: putative zinc-binding protein [Acetobacteraceae bacterium]|nr:putative zinc-binding protein [Acetobacteraceae bacterium]